MTDDTDDETTAEDVQRDVILRLLDQHNTVEQDANSQIHVYLREHSTALFENFIEPYHIEAVHPLDGDGRFDTKVTLDADWTEVDFDAYE
jgi:hypothetical protein